MQFTERSNFSQVLRGVVTAILITLISVLLFSLVLSLTNLNENVIKPVNQFIKLLSVFFGCFISVRGEKGFIKGGLIGLISSILTVLLFSLLSGGINWFGVIIDIVCAFLMGAISGAISVNVRR
ncbi:MAG: TIGR04086 family membrane protein [Clostridiales bacterium]|nr:TIGR04086 family membrane protein [Clostridiales bacterium]